MIARLQICFDLMLRCRPSEMNSHSYKKTKTSFPLVFRSQNSNIYWLITKLLIAITSFKDVASQKLLVRRYFGIMYHVSNFPLIHYLGMYPGIYQRRCQVDNTVKYPFVKCAASRGASVILHDRHSLAIWRN